MITGNSFGDPHVTTLDGLEYDYNGIGEYWMIKSNVINVQARTIVALNRFNEPVNASVFGAYGIQVPSSDVEGLRSRIHIEMTSDRTGN